MEEVVLSVGLVELPFPVVKLLLEFLVPLAHLGLDIIDLLFEGPYELLVVLVSIREDLFILSGEVGVILLQVVNC